jgi:hypothetical protein
VRLKSHFQIQWNLEQNPQIIILPHPYKQIEIIGTFIALI